MIGEIGDFLKAALRRPLRRMGYDLVRYVDMPDEPFDVLSLVVEAQIAAGRTVRFLQVGANDGVLEDPIRHLILRHRLPGLLVEPIPDIFARLGENYAGQPGVAFEQCAVGEEDGEATLYRVLPDPRLPEWMQGIASFDKGHVSARKFNYAGLGRHVEALRIPVLSFPSLLRKHDMDGCDLLQIDTEGHDCRLVRSAIQSGLRPGIINYENMYAPPDERVRVKRLLLDHGYAFLDVGRDTIAVHRSWCKAPAHRPEAAACPTVS